MLYNAHTAASLSPPSPLFLFLSLCASLCSLSIYKSLVLWVATFALSLSCYEFACIIRKEFLAYGSQSFMLAPPATLHPCAPLSALLNLYKCSLCLPLWRCFLLSLESVLFLLDMLCGVGEGEWHKVLHISLRWIFAFLLCRYVIPAALRMRYVGRATLCGCCCICYFANLLQIFTYDLLFERAAFARTGRGRNWVWA